MYGHGHPTGTKTVTRKSQSWYDQIAEENIARIEAEDTERAMVTALAHQVGNAVSALPEAANRIARAASLVQTHQVWPLTTSGSYLVGSQSDTLAAHLVTRGPWTCTCADHTHRHTTCKHQLAVMITVKLGATYQPSY
jgi:hypothetical protein